MPKCDNCDKIIAKKSPILECNKCSKIVHANQGCTGLSSKQLSALRNTENLEWTCEECRKESPRRKSFVSLEEDDEEEEDEILMCQEGSSKTNAMKKLLSDISNEVKKAVKKEIASVNEAIASCCQKMDGIMETMEMISGKIKELEKRNVCLTNQYKHLELKMGAMEQHIGVLEQKQLNNVIEVTGVPKVANDNLENISHKLAGKLNLEPKYISTATRLRGKNGKEGIIQITFNKEEQVDQWIRAAKKDTLFAENVVTCVDPVVAKSKVMVRRALSFANKNLLWQTKLKLRDTHKYIWFQGGKILVRKNENDKATVIKNIDDIEKYATANNENR